MACEQRSTPAAPQRGPELGASIEDIIFIQGLEVGGSRHQQICFWLNVSRWLGVGCTLASSSSLASAHIQGLCFLILLQATRLGSAPATSFNGNDLSDGHVSKSNHTWEQEGSVILSVTSSNFLAVWCVA